MVEKRSVIERTAECKRLIDSGMSLRAACKKAGVDDKTYKKNLPLLNDIKSKQEDTMHTTVNKERAKDITPTPINLHVKSHVKRKQILIRVPIDVYDYLVGEADKTGYKLSSVAASRVIMSVREDIKKKNM